jgi:hypothetical protein
MTLFIDGLRILFNGNTYDAREALGRVFLGGSAAHKQGEKQQREPGWL